HHRGQIGQWNELAVVQTAANKTSITIPALFAVGNDIDARANLSLDSEPHGIVSCCLEFRLAQTAFEPFVQGLYHPARSWPTANAHHRQGGDGGDGSWAWPFGGGSFHWRRSCRGETPRWRWRWRRRNRGWALRQRSLANQIAS